ncbi:protein FAM221A isoform X2 [Ranitomeya imitator]|uniref:protein FAM221A isoform X2 n=1 Tax=Ranitomeya imitator TaxID=111125 RepID=UPI0037E94548
MAGECASRSALQKSHHLQTFMNQAGRQPRATHHGSTSHTSWIYEPHVMDLRATRHGSTSHTSWIYEPHVMDLRATRHGSTSHTSWIYEPHVMDLRATRHGSTSHTSWTHEPHLMDPTHIGEPRFKECRHLEQKDTRYKQHKTDFKELPKDRPILLPCKVSKCPCKSYHYAPLNGSQPIRCRCKHFADDHSVTGSYNCTKCSNCSGFHSSFTCGCSQPAYAHDTVVETKEERQALGKPVGHDVPYAAMGGLTGFSSLAEGYMRLDESGIGAPSKSFLETPDDGGSHPFLRAYGPPSSNVKELPEGNNQASSLKTSEEQDMAYFERRYQERLQKEREQKRLSKDPKHPRNQRP